MPNSQNVISWSCPVENLLLQPREQASALLSYHRTLAEGSGPGLDLFVLSDTDFGIEMSIFANPGDFRDAMLLAF